MLDVYNENFAGRAETRNASESWGGQELDKKRREKQNTPEKTTPFQRYQPSASLPRQRQKQNRQPRDQYGFKLGQSTTW
jgi:hypothetical protein